MSDTLDIELYVKPEGMDLVSSNLDDIVSLECGKYELKDSSDIYSVYYISGCNLGSFTYNLRDSFGSERLFISRTISANSDYYKIMVSSNPNYSWDSLKQF